MERKYLISGLILLFLGVLNLIASSLEGVAAGILWLCPASLFLAGIGILKKDNFLISSSLTASFLLNFIWAMDYISFMLTGTLVTGIASFLPYASPLRLFVTSYHLFLLFIPVFIIFEEKKFHKMSWLGASVFLLVLSVLSLFTKKFTNVNCVHEICDLGIFTFLEPVRSGLIQFIPSFIVQWLFMTIVIFIPTHFFFRAVVAWASKEN